MNERMKRTAAMIEHAVLKLAKEAREPRGTATTVGHTIGRLAAHGVGIRIRGGGPHRINDLQLDVELYQGRTTAPNPRLRLRWDEENEIPSIAWQNAEQGTRITMLPAGAAHDEKLLGPEAPDTRLLPTGQWAAETLASLWTPLAVLWKDKSMQPAICRTPDLVTLERLATETDHALRLISAWSVIGERRLAQLAVELGRKQGASLTLWWNDDGDGAQNAGPQQVRRDQGGRRRSLRRGGRLAGIAAARDGDRDRRIRPPRREEGDDDGSRRPVHRNLARAPLALRLAFGSRRNIGRYREESRDSEPPTGGSSRGDGA